MFETQLLNAMSKVGKGSFASAFTNLIYKHRCLLDQDLEQQITYVLDVTTSRDFEVEHDTGVYHVKGPSIDYTISNLDFSNQTCTLRNSGRFSNPRFECYDGLLSVIDSGEVVLIIPL